MLEDEEGHEPVLYPQGTLEVDSANLIQICDDVLAGNILPSYCEHIGFELVTSKCFSFTDSESGARAFETAEDWDHTDSGYKLTTKTIEKYKERLLSGKSLFTDLDLSAEK